MAVLGDLVSVEGLAANLGRDDVKIIDGTWCMPGEAAPLPGKFIPGAQLFDVDVVADPSSTMKHMLPPAEIFEAAVSEMGIRNTDHVVIYDRHGFRAAPRTWWTFRMFGHANVSILDGGLPDWIEAGHEVSDSSASFTPSNFLAGAAIAKVALQNDVKAVLGGEVQIVDARSEGRFHGTEPEPRAGLRSGHIPGSINLPFSRVRDERANLKSPTELADIVGDCGIDLSKPIITTCGSGMTAAGLAFVFHRLGARDVSVYDGSWTEWGASDAPIEV